MIENSHGYSEARVVRNQSSRIARGSRRSRLLEEAKAEVGSYATSRRLPPRDAVQFRTVLT
jgi:hypothetical protein